MMNMRCIAMVLALGLLGMAPVAWGESLGTLTAIPVGGWYIYDSKDDVDNGTFYGARIGYEKVGKDLGDSVGVELFLAQGRADAKDGGDDVTMSLARLDAIYPFTPKDRVIPFLALGGGALELKGDAESTTNVVISYGGGFKFRLASFMLLRLEMRHNIVYKDELKNNYEASAGLTFAMGLTEPKKPEPVRDSDGDGVIDSDDACPGTPKDIRIDKRGCPLDDDNDGVPDFRDRCPGTPAGTPVDVDGCEMIPLLPVPEQVEGAAGTAPAAQEKPVAPAVEPVPGSEPPTATPAEVTEPAPAVQEAPAMSPTAADLGTVRPDEKAVPAPPAAEAVATAAVAEPAADTTPPSPTAVAATETVPAAAPLSQPLAAVFFGYNSYQLSPASRKLLARHAQTIIKKLPGTVLLEGYSDARGSDEYNLALGERRAQAVRNYLISRGVPSKRLAIVSYGKERPAMAGSTEDAWARNRRVEFFIGR